MRMMDSPRRKSISQMRGRRAIAPILAKIERQINFGTAFIPASGARTPASPSPNTNSGYLFPRNLFRNSKVEVYIALGAEFLHQGHSLREIDVAVVVPVDEKDGRLPGLDGGHRRGIKSQLPLFRRHSLSCPETGIPRPRRPVAHPGQVHSRL